MALTAYLALVDSDDLTWDSTTDPNAPNWTVGAAGFEVSGGANSSPYNVGWIEIHAFNSWLEGGITVIKTIEVSSPQLGELSVSGATVPAVHLVLPNQRMAYTLIKATVTSFRPQYNLGQSTSGGMLPGLTEPFEEVSLTCQRFRWRYIEAIQDTSVTPATTTYATIERECDVKAGTIM